MVTVYDNVETWIIINETYNQNLPLSSNLAQLSVSFESLGPLPHHQTTFRDIAAPRAWHHVTSEAAWSGPFELLGS